MFGVFGSHVQPLESQDTQQEVNSQGLSGLHEGGKFQAFPSTLRGGQIIQCTTSKQQLFCGHTVNAVMSSWRLGISLPNS